MGSIFTPLPYEVREKGRIYTLIPWFDNVLQMYQAIEGLDAWDKPEVMLSYLVKQKVKPSLELLQAVSKVLFPPSKGSGDKAFDFVQDSPLIYAAFYQAYGLDLIEQQGKLHWWKFQSLLNGLPSNTRFSEIVSIRMKPIPAPTKYNQQEREELMRLKSLYAVKLTAEERQSQLQQSLRNVVNYLQSVAKGK
jgi:hypothetical protein